jgi:hypothetical protein
VERTVTTLWNGRAFWSEYIAPEPKPEPHSGPHPGPPSAFVPGQALSFCFDCSSNLRPGQRCSTVSAQARREMTPAELFKAPLCPLDLEDELYRRKYGATKAEMAEGERVEKDLQKDDDKSQAWCYVPNPLRRWRKKASK